MKSPYYILDSLFPAHLPGVCNDIADTRMRTPRYYHQAIFSSPYQCTVIRHTVRLKNPVPAYFSPRFRGFKSICPGNLAKEHKVFQEPQGFLGENQPEMIAAFLL